MSFIEEQHLKIFSCNYGLQTSPQEALSTLVLMQHPFTRVAGIEMGVWLSWQMIS